MIAVKGNGHQKASTSAGDVSPSSDVVSNSESSEGASSKRRLSKTPPSTIEINSTQIHFPFRPYEVQVNYMKSVLNALQQSEHALLESPTGTGKTLCLLCSTLGWQSGEGARIRARATHVLSEGSSVSSLHKETKNESTKIPTIVYASRTHSQLSQVIRELRNTRYRPRHVVLGSREHMCVHPRVNPTSKLGAYSFKHADSSPVTSSEVNHGCNKMNKERKCLYRNNLEELAGGSWTAPSNERIFAGGENEQPVLDLEELVSLGKRHRICPFYHTRSLVKDAELILVPYNYLFDRDARETTLAEVDFENAILIFDEAHNLEDFASESCSFDLSSSDVAGCVGEVQRALQYLELYPEMDEGHKMKDNLLRLKRLFLKFEQYLVEGMVHPTSGRPISSDSEASYPGEFIFDVFQEGAEITHNNQAIFVDFVRQVGDLILESRGGVSSSTGTPKLDHFASCVKRVYGTGNNLLALARAKSYRVHVTKANSKSNNMEGGFTGGRTISFWCFAPALAMRELSHLNVRSILITSGTLSPLPSFSLELGLKFRVQLENSHVITPEQIFLRVLGKGVSGKLLSSKFERRDDPEYILELGNTLASLCRVIPGGVLVFFPSYGTMDKCIQSWGGPSKTRFYNSGGDRATSGRAKHFFAPRKKQSRQFSFPQQPAHLTTVGTNVISPWKRLLARKAIVLEPRTSSDLSDAIAEFKKFLAMPKGSGCILMGVCRGKISEGIDFSDDMCRAVIVTGLPFPPFLDPKVKLKREFLDAARAREKTQSSTNGGFENRKEIGKDLSVASITLSGAEWYNQQAHRAVNQAIGRVIRHRQDYGAVLLLDHRFVEPRNREGLSKWLRPYLRDESIGAATRGLVQFFKEMTTKLGIISTETVRSSRFRRPAAVERPTIAFEDEHQSDREVKKIAVIQTTSSTINENGEISRAQEKSPNECKATHGYIQPDRIIKRFDLSDSSKPAADAVRSNNDGKRLIKVDDSLERGCDLASSEGLVALYNKKKDSTEEIFHSSCSLHKETSTSWASVKCNGATTDSFRPIIKRRLISKQGNTKEKHDTKMAQAARFFEQAKETLCTKDLLTIQKMLTEMKSHGDTKDFEQYMGTARELVLLLARDSGNVINFTHHRLIFSLFPLLPTKYRQPIEEMATTILFEKSDFRNNCVKFLTEEDILSVKKRASRILLHQTPLPNGAVTDILPRDRIILEDAKKILVILLRYDEVLQKDESSLLVSSFFDLLRDRYLRRIQALTLELRKAADLNCDKTGVPMAYMERSVNTALFRPPETKQLRSLLPLETERLKDIEAEKTMEAALTFGMAINKEKLSRAKDIRLRTELKPQPPGHYHTALSTESLKRHSAKMDAEGYQPRKRTCTESSNEKSLLCDLNSKNTCEHVSSMANSNPVEQTGHTDQVDTYLQNVKYDYIGSVADRSSTKTRIKARVPEGFICTVCESLPKEPLIADCGHSACLDCWMKWLRRSKTCPVCRKYTDMNGLAKMVFRTTAVDDPTLTQICSGEDNDGSSCDDELEII